MSFAQSHDRAITVAFEDIADGFIEYGLFCAIHVPGGCLIFNNSSRFSSRGHSYSPNTNVKVELCVEKKYSTDVLDVKGNYTSLGASSSRPHRDVSRQRTHGPQVMRRII